MRSIGLFSKALGILLGLFGVTALVMAGFSAWNINQILSSEFQSKGKAISESIAGTSVEMLLNRDPATVQAMIDERRDGTTGVGYILVMDDKGQVIAHTFVPTIPEQVLHLERDRLKTISQEVHVDGVGDCIDLCSPILAGQIGFVHVGMDRGPIQSSIWQRSLQMAGLFAVLFTFSSLATYLLMRKVSMPLRRLTDAANKLATGEALISSQNGELPEWFPQGAGTDEVSQLTRAFRFMVQGVVGREQHLKHQFKLLLDSTSEAIYGIDLEGRCVFCNPACLQILGYKSAEELLGKGMHGLIHHTRPDGTPYPVEECGIYLAHRSGTASHNDSEVLWRADGTSFPAEYWSNPMREAGVIVGSVVTFVNISQRKAAEAELRKVKEAAVAANVAKSEFLANMSHEIRTPMNGIIGMSELALDTDLTGQQREYLTMVRTSAESLLTVLNDILDFSKIEAGKLELDPIPFDLRDCVGDVVKVLGYRAEQKGLELACDVDADVPNALIGDAGRLRQVLVNLLGNAVKFTDRGEIVVHVEVETVDKEGACLHFAVRDTGIGIPADKHASIFEAFTQADNSTTRQFGGTGLGLSICVQLVRLMGGRMWLESEPGKGSTFHFIAHVGRQRGPAARPMSIKPSTLRNLAALIVDDNATNRRILHDLLNNWGMKPTAVDGGSAGLIAMNKAAEAGEPFSLILLDAMMPQMDGFTFVDHVKADPRFAGTTILLLSSACQRGDAQRCRENGIAAYLSKPIKQSDLLDAILMTLFTPARTEVQPPLVTRHSVREQRGLKVLLAEDNIVNQKVAVSLMQRNGHLVQVACNGQEAVDAWHKDVFDLILMDVQMPVLDGLSATAVIRRAELATGHHVPIIGVTAHALTGDRERFLQAGMDGYVSKPIRPELLWKEVLRLVPEPEDAEASSSPMDSSVVAVKQYSQTAEALNRDQLYEQFAGDQDSLREIIAIAPTECDRLLREIHAALERGNAEDLERAAHSLKGTVGSIAARTAHACAARLEQLARQNNLGDAASTAVELDKHIQLLQVALATLSEELGAAAVAVP